MKLTSHTTEENQSKEQSRNTTPEEVKIKSDIGASPVAYSTSAVWDSLDRILGMDIDITYHAMLWQASYI